MDNSHYDQILFQERLRAAETESDYKLFSMLQPKLYVDGDHWCCLWGCDLQVGIAAFGKTPIEAIRNWNAEWHEPMRAAKGGSMSVIGLREPENICPTGLPDDLHHDCKETIASLERENAELRKRLAEVEEREAACCPEDVGFDEYIAELRKLVEQIAEQKLSSELSKSEQANFEGCYEDAYDDMITDARSCLSRVGANYG